MSITCSRPVRADLLTRLGHDTEARVEWRRAAAQTQNAAERAVLLRRADALAAAAATGPILGPAVARFLARDDLAGASRRSYAQTLRRLSLRRLDAALTTSGDPGTDRTTTTLPRAQNTLTHGGPAAARSAAAPPRGWCLGPRVDDVG